MVLNFKQFMLRQFINEIIQTVMTNSNRKGLEVRLDIEQDIPEYLKGDTESLSKVLLLLLKQAQNRTDKGSITINIKSKQAKDKYIAVIFSVRDSGVALTEEQIKHLFYSKNLLKRENDLNFCHDLVKKIGGEIWITKGLAFGAEFNMIVPLEILKDKICVLVVEDNKVNRLLACKMLENKGYAYKAAQDGREALEIFRQEQFDIILMDIYMPEMDGCTVTRSIREQGSSIPIIALTADGSDEDYKKCMDAGMNYYLTKPIDFETLFLLFQNIFSESENKVQKDRRREIVNPADIFLKLNSDEAFFKQMIRMFEESSKELIATMHKAVLEEDAEQFVIAAHTLKGAIGVFEADGVFEMAKKAEMMGRDKNFKEVKQQVDRLEEAVASITAAFDNFIITYQKV